MTWRWRFTALSCTAAMMRPMSFCPLARVADTTALAALALLLPLAPLLLASIARDGSYLRRYRGTLRQWLRMLRTMARTSVVARNLQRSWNARRGAAAPIEGECTHCGQCCIQRECVFLRFDAQGRSQCAIHGTWYWRLTSCGRYPIDAADIEFYACPSYRVIPIASTNAAGSSPKCG